MTDGPITPMLLEGEFRVLDTDLAERLHFKRPRTIRTLISRWRPELERLGICCAVQQNHGGGRGRPTMAYYLNRKQAIFITGKSDTPEATDITIEIIHRFDEYESGGTPPTAPPAQRLEHRAFPDWPLEEMRTKKGVVDMYRHLYGTMAAQWISPQVGFPSPPIELVEHGRQMKLVLSAHIGAA